MDYEAKTQEQFNAMSPQELADLWLEAKASENAVVAYRTMLDNALAHQLLHKTEGSVTHDLGAVKVTVTGVLYRKVDEGKWKEIQGSIPEDLSPIDYVETLKVNSKACTWLAENEPKVWQTCDKALTIKPGKPGVKVERKGE